MIFLNGGYNRVTLKAKGDGHKIQFHEVAVTDNTSSYATLNVHLRSQEYFVSHTGNSSLGLCQPFGFLTEREIESLN